MELERQHACAQHVLHCMNGHYNLLLCYLSALCTFARNALIISIAKRAGNLRFYIHHIYTKVNGGAFTAATGGRKNSNGRTKKQSERRIFQPPVTAILPYLHASCTIPCTCGEPHLHTTCSADKVQAKFRCVCTA